MFNHFNDNCNEPRPYLISTSYEHCLQYCRIEPKYKKEDISPNVFAVLAVGAPMWFEIDANGVNRNVKCYSQGNGVLTNRDVVEVFHMIQNNCVAWCEI